MTEQEKNELRIYLRTQINKIKNIIHLRKMKIICVLRKIVRKLLKYTYDRVLHLFPSIYLDEDLQITFYQELISVFI